MNDRESLTAAWLIANGNAVHTEGGWPDLLCVSPEGRVFAVEVKSWQDKVRPNQEACHRILKAAGIDVIVKTINKDGTGLDWPEGPSQEEMMEALDRTFREAQEGSS